jgi:hypothetical protein
VNGLAGICVFSFSPRIVKKVGVTVATASLAFPVSLVRLVANDGTYTASLMFPQKKNQEKSRKVRPGK